MGAGLDSGGGHENSPSAAAQKAQAQPQANASPMLGEHCSPEWGLAPCLALSRPGLEGLGDWGGWVPISAPCQGTTVGDSLLRSSSSPRPIAGLRGEGPFPDVKGIPSLRSNAWQ